MSTYLTATELVDVDGYHRWVETGKALAVGRKPAADGSPPPLR